MILPNIWKNEIHVPNHQPVAYSFLIYRKSWQKRLGPGGPGDPGDPGPCIAELHGPLLQTDIGRKLVAVGGLRGTSGLCSLTLRPWLVYKNMYTYIYDHTCGCLCNYVSISVCLFCKVSILLSPCQRYMFRIIRKKLPVNITTLSAYVSLISFTDVQGFGAVPIFRAPRRLVVELPTERSRDSIHGWADEAHARAQVVATIATQLAVRAWDFFRRISWWAQGLVLCASMCYD